MSGRRWVFAAITGGMVAGLVGLSLPRWVGASGNDQARWTEAARLDALARARLWQAPAVAIEQADLSKGRHPLGDELSCTYHPADSVSGTTPKFECELPGGEIVKVKYRGPERHAEVAATRLLSALGFGADEVTLVRRVRCRGCPREPFVTTRVLTLARANDLYDRWRNREGEQIFDWVAVERRMEGERIETPEAEGWTWAELAAVQRGANTHADALRLLAVFLAHWDNKSENQRLICESGPPTPQGRCERPFAMLQDVGATFGPWKANLEKWRAAPVWSDRAACVVSMERLPYDGATFVPRAISEEGRRFLGDRLGRLSSAQIRALFEGARFDQHDGTVTGWTDAFTAKVAQIVEGPPCPGAAPGAAAAALPRRP